MSKYPGRRISATPPSVSTSAASGVWTLEEVMQYRQAGTWPVGVAGGDPNFNQTVLLLHGDGNQGANNLYNPGPPRYLAFTDNSDNNFPITVNGDAYGDNFSPFMVEEGQWSNSLKSNGTSGDYYRSAATTPFTFGTGDFCVESWVYLDRYNNNPSWHPIFDTRPQNSTNGNYPILGFAESSFSPTPYALFIGNGTTSASTYTPPLNQWLHIVWTRVAGINRAFVNGVLRIYASNSTNALCGANGIRMGSESFNSSPNTTFPGYFSNYRVIKGGIPTAYATSETVVGTTVFTPPTTPLSTGDSLTAGSVSLLTFQSNRVVDQSGSVTVLVGAGTPQVKPFNPFTTTYSSTNGSGYFDGTGDNLRAPDNAAFQFGTGNFTIEAWVYPTSYSAARGVFGNGGTSNGTLFSGINTSGRFESWIYGDSVQSPSINIPLNAWTHLVVTRSGTAFRTFVNGVQDISYTTSRDISAQSCVVGNSYTSGADMPFLGYISNLKVVKGVGVTSVTVPTAPFTSDSNTSLLTCQYQGSVRNVGFIDSSPYDHVITRNPATGPNAPTQGTFSPFSAEPGKWSNYFDGNDDLRIAASTGSWADFGTGDFTIAAWVYVPAVSALQGICGAHTSAQNNTWQFRLNGSTLELFGANQVSASTTAVSANQWVFVTASRSGANVYLGVNGTVNTVALTAGAGGLFSTTSGGNVSIGNLYSTPSNYWLTGYISGLTIINGTALFTSNFTPSTSPASTSTINQQLLTCYGNRFADFNTATTAKTITVSGNPRVTPFSPFAPTAAYDAGTNGGSGYFDGTGDYLLTTNAAALAIGTSAFTLEGWCYFNNVNTSGAGFGSCASAAVGTDGTNDRGVSLFLTGSGAWRFRVGRSSTGQFEDFLGTTTLVPGQWYHFKMVRTSTGSNDTRIYLNGVQEAIGTSTIGINMQKFAIGIYTPSDTSGAPLNGYVAGVRFTNTAESSAIPTAPPTAVSGTQYLVNFTNAGIFDQTGKNVLETVGNAQVDTSVKKFGTGSMKFDGTTGKLIGRTSQELYMGSGDFTVEAWIYWAGTSTFYQNFVGSNSASFTGNATFFRVWGTSAPVTALRSKLGIGNLTHDGTSSVYSVNNVPVNTWTHVAATRQNGIIRIFINGVLERTGSTDTSVYDFGDNGICIGQAPWDGANGWYTGYIDDLRITKGVARYPSQPFPTLPFPDK